MSETPVVTAPLPPLPQPNVLGSCVLITLCSSLLSFLWQDDESDSDSTETEHLLSPVKIRRPKTMPLGNRSVPLAVIYSVQRKVMRPKTMQLESRLVPVPVTYSVKIKIRKSKTKPSFRSVPVLRFLAVFNSVVVILKTRAGGRRLHLRGSLFSQDRLGKNHRMIKQATGR